jgi:hypothetical protein
MTKKEELLRHAARCGELADNCCDTAVAEKLRELAQYYRSLANGDTFDLAQRTAEMSDLGRNPG